MTDFKNVEISDKDLEVFLDVLNDYRCTGDTYQKKEAQKLFISHFHPIIEKVARNTLVYGKKKYPLHDKKNDFLLALAEHFPDGLILKEDDTLDGTRSKITSYIVGQRGRIFNYNRRNRNKLLDKYKKEYLHTHKDSERSRLLEKEYYKECKRFLSERDSYIVDKIISGYKVEDLAKELNLTKSRVYSILDEIREIIESYNKEPQ